jgi:hypothetical protein
MELLKKETAEAQRDKQEHTVKKEFGLNGETNSDIELLSTPSAKSADSLSRSDESMGVRSSSPSTVNDPNETPDQRLARLRHAVERVVRKPGAPLKSAPFHTASTMKALDPGTEVLIVILSPYWFGVETHDGEHGWIRRDQLEPLP